MRRHNIHDKEGRDDEGDSGKRKQGNQLEDVVLRGWYGERPGWVKGRGTGGEESKDASVHWGIMGKNLSVSDCVTLTAL